MNIGPFTISIKKKKAKTGSLRKQLMQELLDAHVRWSNLDDKEAAAAYMLLIHNFSRPDETVQEAEDIK